jgi:hypothetical protein
MNRNKRELCELFGRGALVGLGLISILTGASRMRRKEENMAKKNDKKKEPATLFRYDIIDECPCGEAVKPYERHQLVFCVKNEVWYRACASCLNKGKTFNQ